jgi:RNA polymerase sigma-B factor
VSSLSRGVTGPIDEARSAELFRRLPGDQRARDDLVTMYLPLAEYLARRFNGRGEALDDLVQVAGIGLIKAVDRFDSDRGIKFSTYATATIVGELKRHFRDRGWMVRVPRRLQEISVQTGKVVSGLSQELGRSPTVREIAERTGYTEEEVVEGMYTAHAYAPISLDAKWNDEESVPLVDRLASEDDSLEILEQMESVGPAIRELSVREQRIIFLRFFRGLTQAEIAQELGISQMHVSRLLARSLHSIRRSARGDA